MYISLPPARNTLTGWGTSGGKSGWGASVRLPNQKPSGIQAVVAKKQEQAPKQEPAPEPEPEPEPEPAAYEEPLPVVDPSSMPDYTGPASTQKKGIDKKLIIGGGLAIAGLVAAFTLMD